MFFCYSFAEMKTLDLFPCFVNVVGIQKCAWHFLKHFYNNDVVWVFIVAYNVYRVHFLPRNEHTVFLLQTLNGLILFREIIGNYSDSHVRHENTLCGQN
jgi:hypothetical protein